MLYKRDLETVLKRFSKFPVVAILGPRQSGKTTLAQKYFHKHTFLSFEDPAIREFASADPRRFLADNENEHGLILDEFQYVPEILSYIQLEVDSKKRPGYFVLSGSQNFLMNQAITQSLAGRVGILTLLPLSLHEMQKNKIIHNDVNSHDKTLNVNEIIFHGGYPRPYIEGLDYVDFYSSYIHTYLERDVRQIIRVDDLRTFQKFLGLCAGRIGQLLNLSDLAVNCSISVPTAHAWLALLEASYVIFLLQPHFNNFNKRLTKTPKLYFYDTGVACNLLNITSPEIVSMSPFRGHLFENLIVSDFKKQFLNEGRRPPLYFWRDTNGRIEVDCIVDLGIKLIPIEIKASQTISATSFFEGIKRWNEISDTKVENNYVVYGGTENQTREAGSIVSLYSSSSLMQKLQEDQGAETLSEVINEKQRED